MSAAAAAAGSIGGAFIGGAMTLGGTALQYKYNKQLMEQQNQYNIDMWKMQNEYNSPSAQMQRYKDAGLNPNLIYGSGSASAGNASSAPVMQVPEAPRVDKAAQELSKAFNLSNIIGNFLDLKSKEEDLRAKRIANQNALDERRAMNDLSTLYDFDPETGSFVWHPDGLVTRTLKGLKGWEHRLAGPSTSAYRANMIKGNMFRAYKPFELYPSLVGYRNALAGSVPYRNTYLERLADLLLPELEMRRYDAKYYPYSYWIDRSTKVAGSITDAIRAFNPVRMAKNYIFNH